MMIYRNMSRGLIGRDTLYLAEKITFTQVESAVSQQVVGGRHMKIEIRQHKAQQIALAGEIDGVTPELYFELTSLATLELLRLERRKEIQ